MGQKLSEAQIGDLSRGQTDGIGLKPQMDDDPTVSREQSNVPGILHQNVSRKDHSIGRESSGYSVYLYKVVQRSSGGGDEVSAGSQQVDGLCFKIGHHPIINCSRAKTGAPCKKFGV